MDGKNKQTVITKYGQLVTTLINKTVNLSYDYRLWRVDRVTSWLASKNNMSNSDITVTFCEDLALLAYTESFLS